MSTSLKTKPLTVQQRATEATRQTGEFLQVGDLKLLTTALLEAASEGVRRNPSFATHVRALYQQLEQQSAPKHTRRTPSKGVSIDDDLIPIRRIETHEINIAASLDPYFLNELYGPHQLRKALARYKLLKLKEAVAAVQQKHPGTKPARMNAAAPIIDYIVEYVAGSGD